MGRGWSHRVAMMKNMVTSLIEHERIKTNLTKAKEVSRLCDRMVTWAKRGDQQGYRKVARYVRTRQCITKLFTILSMRFKERQGGYTRVLKTYPRMGDHAEMAFVELVDRPMLRMPYALPEQPQSVMPGRGGRSWRVGKRQLNDERSRRVAAPADSAVITDIISDVVVRRCHRARNASPKAGILDR
ncbi:ribosomal protein l17 [Chrysochromulina tobinii]|uniref:Ribosomal protein l17 n=1 Tax=Chrysochromulina tobinii TaxID=1460289 RepID=A0A0M0K0H4_9EUKA|nr:ribosomal protein l17 [Chrysochromulina tobinii]|eukprot:KOO32077.1 ribosomal protein l17 [Chrysochromulina sp. CCMP291]